MTSLIKSSFFWQFTGGFALGAIGLIAMHPAEANRGLARDLAVAVHANR